MYQYRWLVAVCCGLLVITFGYVIDVRDMLSEYASLISREVFIKNQLARQEQSAHANNMTDTMIGNMPETPIKLREFLWLSSANEIEIISLVNSDAGSAPEAESEVFQFVLNADYARLVYFLWKLAEADEKYSIVDFEIRGLHHNRVSLALSLSMSRGVSEGKRNFKKVNSENNPFCESAPSDLFNAIRVDEVMRYSLQDIRFIGVVSFMNHDEAVVLFPDGAIKTLTIHARIGKEGGEIDEINATKLAVIMPNHTRRVLIKNLYN